MKTTNAGKMRWRATIKSPSTTKLPSGQRDPELFDTVATVWCDVEATGGDEVNSKNRFFAGRFTVKMRLNTSILTGWALTFDGKPYTGVTVYVVSFQHSLTETLLECVE